MKPLFFRLLHLFRYRFFVLAGALPYVLGAAIAFYHGASFNVPYFLLGLLGMVLAFAGVELFNEYFEPADKLFSENVVHPSRYRFWVGVGCFILALPIGIFLALKTGFFVIVLAFLGFLIAFFYVGPPLRLIYRGLGEIVIFLAYGPLMVLGSYYIQSLKVDVAAIFDSLIPGSLILSLAILNEIPDYYQDMVAGKRNIVVRLGRGKGAALYMTFLFSSYVLVILGVIINALPWLSLLALLSLPVAVRAGSLVRRYHDEPAKLLPVVNNTVLSYVAVNALVIISLFLG